MHRITRRALMKQAACAAAGAVAAIALPRPEARAGQGGKRRPNLIFILIDDFGWTDVGCYGSTFYETPHLDRLAAGGMRFTSAYAASPVCSPTRASIMTGRNPARLHLTNFLVGNRWPADSPLEPFEWQYFLPLEEVTVADALKAAGYATGYVGKWHLGNDPYSPEAQGFDFNVGGCHMGAPRTYFDPYNIPKLSDRTPGEYLTDRLTDEAERFIETHKDRPFFLCFAHYAVHIPLQAKKPQVDKYEAKRQALPEPRPPTFGQEGRHKVRLVHDHPVYAGMIESMDQSVGRILDKLQALGLADDTAVLFMSDNGGLSTAEGHPTANVPLRAGKGWLYEGGIREPMIVRWPGVTRPGSTCDVPVISDDFFPTMLEMAGAAPPAGLVLDGTSIVPLLRGTADLARGPLCWHYPHYSNQGGRPGGAARDGPWKLVEHFEDGRLELFNLRDDLGEQKDLAAAMPEKVGQLRAVLAAWRERLGAQMPGRKAAPPPARA